MVIHLYAVAWNEEKILPYFLRHYQPLVERFFIADHESTDRTPALLRACPKQTSREFSVPGDSFIEAMQADGDHCWKKSRGHADWVIVCDLDEFLYHPNLPTYLRQMQKSGVTIIQAEGWQMVSETFPKSRAPLQRLVRRGTRYEYMDKTIIFNPDAIDEINYNAGHHKVQPVGRIVYPEVAELKLLHYKYLSANYLNERHQAMNTRRHPRDIQLNYGYQYRRTREENLADFQKVTREAVEVLPAASFLQRLMDKFSL